MSNYNFLAEQEQSIYQEIAADIKRAWDTRDTAAVERLRNWWLVNPASTAAYIRQILADYPKYRPSKSGNKSLRSILRRALAVLKHPELLDRNLDDDASPAAAVDVDKLPIEVRHVAIDPYRARHKTAIFVDNQPVYGLPLHNGFALREHGPVYDRTKWNRFYARMLDQRQAGDPVDRAITGLAELAAAGRKVLIVDSTDACHGETLAARIVDRIEQGLPKPAPRSTGSGTHNMDDRDHIDELIHNRWHRVCDYWTWRAWTLQGAAGPARTLPPLVPPDEKPHGYVDLKRIYRDTDGELWYEVEDLGHNHTLARLEKGINRKGESILVVNQRTIKKDSPGDMRTLFVPQWAEGYVIGVDSRTGQDVRKNYLRGVTRTMVRELLGDTELVQLEHRMALILDEYYTLTGEERHEAERLTRRVTARIGVTVEQTSAYDKDGNYVPFEQRTANGQYFQAPAPLVYHDDREANEDASHGRFESHDDDMLTARDNDALESALAACGGSISAAEAVIRGDMDAHTAAILYACDDPKFHQAKAEPIDLVLRKAAKKIKDKENSLYETVRLEILDDLDRGTIAPDQLQALVPPNVMPAYIVKPIAGYDEEGNETHFIESYVWTPLAQRLRIPATVVAVNGFPLPDAMLASRNRGRLTGLDCLPTPPTPWVPPMAEMLAPRPHTGVNKLHYRMPASNMPTGYTPITTSHDGLDLVLAEIEAAMTVERPYDAEERAAHRTARRPYARVIPDPTASGWQNTPNFPHGKMQVGEEVYFTLKP